MFKDIFVENRTHVLGLLVKQNDPLEQHIPVRLNM